MKLQTKDLTGVALDWAVAKCEGWEGDFIDMPNYCTDWARGGPIIERELYKVTQNMGGTWSAQIKYRVPYYSPTYDYDIGADAYINRHGATPLEAAMRCYVASKLGDEVEVTDEIAN